MKHLIRLVLFGISAFAAAPAGADTARDAILADLARQAQTVNPSFTGFSAERGAAFYRSANAAADPDGEAMRLGVSALTQDG